MLLALEQLVGGPLVRVLKLLVLLLQLLVFARELGVLLLLLVQGGVGPAGQGLEVYFVLPSKYYVFAHVPADNGSCQNPASKNMESLITSLTPDKFWSMYLKQSREMEKINQKYKELLSAYETCYKENKELKEKTVDDQ